MADIRETRTVEQEVVVGKRCDVCGKTYRNADPPPTDAPFEVQRASRKQYDEESPTRNWHHFTSGHGDWGNDSVDSWASHDVCSPECYLSVLTEMVEALSDYPTAEIDDMPVRFVKALLDHVKLTGDAP